MEVGTLEVVLGIEAAEFLSSMTSAQKALTAFSGAIVELGKMSIEAASKAQNVASEVRGLFGEQAESIRAFSETAAQALGRNATQIETLVLGFARMAEPLTHNKALAAEMSEELATVAVNMAKALHMSDADAAAKLEAGFRGSARALREFGIDISTTALKNEALSLGFKGSVDHLNAAQSAYLRYQVIMGQSKEIQERATAAAHDYSNELVTMKAHQEELLEQIGSKLLPVWQKWTNDFYSGVQYLIGVWGRFSSAIAEGWQSIKDAFTEGAAANRAGWAAMNPALGPVPQPFQVGTGAGSTGTHKAAAGMLGSLATPGAAKDRSGGAGMAAMNAQQDASAAWFQANSVIGATSKKAAQDAVEAAQLAANNADIDAAVAQAYADSHKSSQKAADAAKEAATAALDAEDASHQASQAFADRLSSESEAEREKAQALQEALSDWKTSVLAKITPNALGNVIQGASQGAAAAGPIGGVVGGITGALSSSQQFQQLMQGVSGIIAIAMHAFDDLFKSLQPLIGAIGMVVGTIMHALKPFFDILGNIIKQLAPVVEVIANVFQSLAPVFAAIAQVLSMVLKPVIFAFKLALDAVAFVLKVVASVILGVFIALGEIWNWIVQAIQDAINWFVHAINDVLGWAGVHINEVDFHGAKLNVDAMNDALHKLWNTTQAQNDAAAQQTYQQDVLAGAAGGAATAINNMTEALINVPQGLTDMVHQAQQAAGSGPQGPGLNKNVVLQVPHFAGGGHVSSPTLALIGEAGGESIVPDGHGSGITVVLMVNDIESAWQKIKQLMKRDANALNGIPFAGVGPRFSAG